MTQSDYGVPNPYVSTTHGYPTRYHGGIWTRPVFGMPYQPAVQSVFKPTDFNDGNPALRAQHGLGEALFEAYEGVFGVQRQGGGVFGPSLYGLGADCAVPAECAEAKARAAQYFNTSLVDGYCDADSNSQNEIWSICTEALRKADAAALARTTAPASTTFTTAQVKALQTTLSTALKAAGYPGISVDGNLGPGTCGAIAWYQKQTGNPTAGASFAAVCATKQPWVMPSKGGAPLPGGPATYQAPTQFAYTPPSSGPSKATMFAIGGGAIAVALAVFGKKQGWF